MRTESGEERVEQGEALRDSVAVNNRPAFISRQISPRTGQPDVADADIASAVTKAQRIVSGLEKISRKYRLDFCDVTIFLACGIINLKTTKQNVLFMQLANQSSIAHYLRMSRETVRRRLVKLEEKALISRLPSGYVINEPQVWLQTVFLLG
jgi:CRP-like cAMP-binding protein